MPPSTFSYTSADGTRIAAYRWDPAGEPRGLRAEVNAELTSWLERVAASAGKAG
jgi:hypothetical protein